MKMTLEQKVDWLMAFAKNEMFKQSAQFPDDLMSAIGRLELDQLTSGVEEWRTRLIEIERLRHAKALARHNEFMSQLEEIQ